MSLSDSLYFISRVGRTLAIAERLLSCTVRVYPGMPTVGDAEVRKLFFTPDLLRDMYNIGKIWFSSIGHLV